MPVGRWMSPEVIEHAPYNEKADVFSFGILVWELLTARVPYSEMTPLQAAVGVVQKGLRPTQPPNCPPALAGVLRACWHRNPDERPPFHVLKVLPLSSRHAVSAALACGMNGWADAQVPAARPLLCENMFY